METNFITLNWRLGTWSPQLRVAPVPLPDVLMEGTRLAGSCAQVMIRGSSALGAATVAENILAFGLLGVVRPGHDPVTMTAAKQLADISFELLRSSEADLRFPMSKVRECLERLTKVVLSIDEVGLNRRHSTLMKPYLSLTEHGTFGDQLATLVNAVQSRPADDKDADRVLDHLEEWADRIYQGTKELFLEAIEKQSFLTFDLINWITNTTTALVVAATAPAASDATREQLIREATWLISVLDWVPDNEGKIIFVETFNISEDLFEVALQIHTLDAEGAEDANDVAIAARDALLRWAFKAGKFHTGWGSLQRALIPLGILAAWNEGSGWMGWLTQAIQEQIAGNWLDLDLRARAARELRRKAVDRGRGEFAFDAVEQALARVDRERLHEIMECMANALDPPPAAA